MSFAKERESSGHDGLYDTIWIQDGFDIYKNVPECVQILRLVSGLLKPGQFLFVKEYTCAYGLKKDFRTPKGFCEIFSFVSDVLRVVDDMPIQRNGAAFGKFWVKDVGLGTNSD